MPQDVATAEPWPCRGSWEDRRDDFIHSSLGFEIIGDGFSNGELTGPVCWNPLSHQLASIDQQACADPLLQAMIT
jgi:hypothetical protein